MPIHSPRYPPPPPPASKGLGPLGWSGVIFVLAVIALAARGFFPKRAVDKVSKNPAMAAADPITANLEDIKNGRFKPTSHKGSRSSDLSGKHGLPSAARTVTLTDEKGKESSLTLDPGPQQVPSWVPSYPGSTNEAFPATVALQGSAVAESSKGGPTGFTKSVSGGFTASSPDSIDKLMEFYESQLKAAGFKTQKKAGYAASGAMTGGTLVGTSDDPVEVHDGAPQSGRTQRLIVIGLGPLDLDGHRSQAVITYAERH